MLRLGRPYTDWEERESISMAMALSVRSEALESNVCSTPPALHSDGEVRWHTDQPALGAAADTENRIHSTMDGSGQEEVAYDLLFEADELLGSLWEHGDKDCLFEQGYSVLALLVVWISL